MRFLPYLKGCGFGGVKKVGYQWFTNFLEKFAGLQTPFPENSGLFNCIQVGTTVFPPNIIGGLETQGNPQLFLRKGLFKGQERGFI